VQLLPPNPASDYSSSRATSIRTANPKLERATHAEVVPDLLPAVHHDLGAGGMTANTMLPVDLFPRPTTIRVTPHMI
jgi:hypothetical protein